jgi:uncharacterized protein (TIGR03089 family)
VTFPECSGGCSTSPGRPRVTWYGPGGERVELSGKTLLNWVSKTANLLVDELDAEPGTAVGIDLPAHWRTVSWLLATWAAGAHALVAPDVGVGGGETSDVGVGGGETSSVPGLDVLVTTEPGPGRAEHVVAVALPALATSFGAPLAARRPRRGHRGAPAAGRVPAVPDAGSR